MEYQGQLTYYDLGRFSNVDPELEISSSYELPKCYDTSTFCHDRTEHESELPRRLELNGNTFVMESFKANKEKYNASASKIRKAYAVDKIDQNRQLDLHSYDKTTCSTSILHNLARNTLILEKGIDGMFHFGRKMKSANDEETWIVLAKIQD